MNMGYLLNTQGLAQLNKAPPYFSFFTWFVGTGVLVFGHGLGQLELLNKIILSCASEETVCLV